MKVGMLLEQLSAGAARQPVLLQWLCFEFRD
jgi:hypothetical protein